MKKYLFIIFALTLPLLLSGCGKDETVDGEITLTFLRLSNDEPEKAFWTEVIASYESQHPGIKIMYDDAAIGDDMDVKLTTLFNANDGPDIIGHGIMSVATRVELGHYLPLTDYYNGWEGKDDIYPQLISLGTYQGNIYGLAYQPTPYVFAYRIDLLREAGYDRPPQTWAELEEYARTLTVTENGRITQAGFAFPAAAGNFVEYDVFAFGNGGGFVGGNQNPSLYTSQNLEALSFVGSLINDVSIDYNANETNPFMTGNAAMTFIDNIRLTPMFGMDEYSGKIGISLPPSNDGKKQMTFSGCRLLFIGKDCKNRDEAFDFIRYALSGEVVRKRSVDLNVPPVLFSQATEFARLDPYNSVRSACVENGIGMPITTWSSLFQRVRNEMVQRVLNGEDPAETLRNAQDKLEQEIIDAK
jgi:ABC-type glycerol-3-phosphate transport system substrate-binding protein